MRVSTCYLFLNFLLLFFNFFLQAVLFKILYPGWFSVDSFALINAFETATEMPVVDVTVSGGGKVARVKFFLTTAALLAIFRNTRRIFPNFGIGWFHHD